MGRDRVPTYRRCDADAARAFGTLMGIYDRDYWQDDAPRTGSGTGRQMVTYLVAVNVAVYLLNLFVSPSHDWVNTHLAARPEILLQPQFWWKFLTYGFAHASGRLGHLFFNMLGLWFFGREVENIYGRREFLRFYLAALLLGSVGWCVREYAAEHPAGLLIGASGAVTAVTLLFVLHHPQQTVLFMMVLPVPAWALGLLIIAWNVLQVEAMTPAGGVAYDVHLIGAAFTVAYFRFGWNLGRLVPRFPSLRRRAKATERPQLRVHDPDDYYRQMDAEADRILEKVSREGLDQLTKRERRMLEDYSRRLRQRQR